MCDIGPEPHANKTKVISREAVPGRFPKWVKTAQSALRFEVKLFLILQKERSFMESRTFPEIPCVICSKPVNLQTDLCADENGKAVHDSCYIRRITRAQVQKRQSCFHRSPRPGAFFLKSIWRHRGISPPWRIHLVPRQRRYPN